MLNFDFYAPTRILFGKGEENRIGSLLKPIARKVLLHYGSGSIVKSGLYDRVVASLNESGIPFVALGGVQPNPRLTLVYEGIALCKREQVDLILAVGGGSVIDSSKAIAMGCCYEGDVWDLYEKGLPVEGALPVASILTIPAAGSESSESSVISNEAKSLKLSCNNPKIRPVLSIVNPTLFYTLPKAQLANGTADMMSHIFERYFTNTTHTDLTDSLCEAALRTIIKNAPIAYADMENYEAWCELGFSGSLAHNSLLGMGRQQDWACHRIEHELSALYDVAHGAGLAVLTPGWMRYVYKENTDMFMRFATRVMEVPSEGRDSESVINEAIDRLQAFFTALGLPSTLAELGIGEDRLVEMAEKASGIAYNREHTLGGLKILYYKDILAILQKVKYSQ